MASWLEEIGVPGRSAREIMQVYRKYGSVQFHYFSSSARDMIRVYKKYGTATVTVGVNSTLEPNVRLESF